MKTFRFLAIMAATALVLTGCNKEKFQTPDLRTFDLQGHVASMTLSYETVTFDVNGNVNTREMQVKRDDQNRIKRYKLKPEFAEGDMLQNDRYYYDENGNVRKIKMKRYAGTSTIKFIYDEKGVLTKSEKKCSAEGEEWKEVATYEITETDSEGNWTKRKVHRTYEGIEQAPEDVVEERVITYYDKDAIKNAAKQEVAVQDDDDEDEDEEDEDEAEELVAPKKIEEAPKAIEPAKPSGSLSKFMNGGPGDQAFFTGKINNKYAVHLSLWWNWGRDGIVMTWIEGAYYYDSTKNGLKNYLTLYEESHQGNHLVISEMNSKGSVTGVFDGRIKGNVYEGTFIRTKDGKTMPFKLNYVGDQGHGKFVEQDM